MIFFKYTEKLPDIKDLLGSVSKSRDLAVFGQERIDMAVFPALQGGPHNHQKLAKRSISVQKCLEHEANSG